MVWNGMMGVEENITVLYMGNHTSRHGEYFLTELSAI